MAPTVSVLLFQLLLAKRRLEENLPMVQIYTTGFDVWAYGILFICHVFSQSATKSMCSSLISQVAFYTGCCNVRTFLKTRLMRLNVLLLKTKSMFSLNGLSLDSITSL